MGKISLFMEKKRPKAKHPRCQHEKQRDPIGLSILKVGGMKKLNRLALGTVFALMVSCAGQQPDRRIASWNDNVESVEVPQVEVISQEQLEEHMDRVVSQAQELGPEMTTYLSTELYLKANDLQARGDLRTSVFIMSYVYQMNPEDKFVQRKLAVDLIRLNELERAVALLEKLKADGPDEVMDLIYAGVLTAQGRNDDARSVYKEVLSDFPDSEEACIFLAKSYAATAEQDKARSLLLECEQRIAAPIFPYYRGKMAVDQQRWDEALESFELALKIEPDFRQAIMAIALIKESQQKYDEALTSYKKILDTSPYHYPVLSRVVQLMFAAEMYDEVIPYAETLAQLDSDDLSLRVRLGILYTDAKEYDRAIENFLAVLEVVPESDKVLYYLGALYQEIQDYPRALHYYNQIPSESALFYDGHLQMGHILHAMAIERPEEFEREFVGFTAEVIDEHEELAFDFSIIRASYFEVKKDYSSAINSLKTLVSNERFGEGHHYYLAALYEKNEEFTKSIQHINIILEENPDHAHALNFLGYTMLERDEDLPQAYQYIKRAVELKPDDGYIRDSLGWYYYKMGDLDRALEEIKKAAQLTQSDMVITKHLAIVYQALEDYDNAKKFYREALSYSRHESERELLIRALEDLEQRRTLASDGAAP